MAAGLSNAHAGDYVAVMDVDLQDPPELLLQMIDILEDPKQDYEVVGCVQTSRRQKPIRKFLSASFYKIINKMSHVRLKTKCSRLSFNDPKIYKRSFETSGTQLI
nr:glycosyltransferase [Lentilactobacillus buchneri]